MNIYIIVYTYTYDTYVHIYKCKYLYVCIYTFVYIVIFVYICTLERCHGGTGWAHDYHVQGTQEWVGGTRCQRAGPWMIVDICLLNSTEY